MFGTKQNIVKKPKSIILMISVWQTQYRSQTYEFTCYTANMCYDPRQFWPTPTKDSYFPLRKLDLKRFAEATKTIWINNWIRLQGQTSSQLSKLLSRQDFTKDYSK